MTNGGSAPHLAGLEGGGGGCGYETGEKSVVLHGVLRCVVILEGDYTRDNGDNRFSVLAFCSWEALSNLRREKQVEA